MSLPLYEQASDLTAIPTTEWEWSAKASAGLSNGSGRSEEVGEKDTAPSQWGIQFLPGEIRQMIYNYVCLHYRVQIQRAPRKQVPPVPKVDEETGEILIMVNWKNSEVFKLTHRKLPARVKSTQEIDAGAPSAFAPPLNLMLSCRSIHDEVKPFLYKHTQFVFHSTRVLNRFLNFTSSEIKSVVHHIEVTHTMYNDPFDQANKKWKTKSDNAWMKTCLRLCLELPALQVFHLELGVFDSAAELRVCNPWFNPYLGLCLFHNMHHTRWLDLNVRVLQIPTEGSQFNEYVHSLVADRYAEGDLDSETEEIMDDLGLYRQRPAVYKTEDGVLTKRDLSISWFN
ncbi:uncharacterized protein N7482_005405 [Penicillium canariense]|uniref:DUF7730 domain-containing protein n=1 Tax=Penicillium canariense TaxID=189055 RepID=A0A9W9I4T5_9EURO|nr:uncharacterized protein N7482_005405 [Penicillium canariense]KAJ5166624.1 hypothetical protein N7482_005405 [Penicillium canariense]